MKKVIGLPDKMSDGNDVLPDIYKFSSDVVQCLTVILGCD